MSEASLCHFSGTSQVLHDTEVLQQGQLMWGPLRCVLQSTGNDLPCCTVRIWKPSVGLTVEVSSLLIFFTMVVFPALSSPLQRPAQRLSI